MERQSGTTAEIYVSNRKAARFNLNGEIQQKEIPTRIGKIKIQFGHGEIRVIHSPCDQKICMLQGAIRHTFEQIVCLPARMQIVLTSTTPSLNSEEIDAVSH